MTPMELCFRQPDAMLAVTAVILFPVILIIWQKIRCIMLQREQFKEWIISRKLQVTGQKREWLFLPNVKQKKLKITDQDMNL